MNAFAYSQLVQDFCRLRIDSIIFPADSNALQVQSCSSSTHASTNSFLHISFTVHNSLHNELVPVTEDEEAAEDLSLALDLVTHPASVLNLATKQSGQVYHGTLDWIFHDVFLVPAPFVSIFDSSGQPVPVESIGAFSRLTHSSASDGEAGSAAGVEGIQLPWQAVEHPVHGVPCYSWHVCDLEGRLHAHCSCRDAVSVSVSRANGRAAVDISSGGGSGGDSSDCSHDPLYLLRALALLGPTVGLPISSGRYVHAQQLLLADRERAGAEAGA